MRKALSPRSRILSDVNVQNYVCLSTVKIDSSCGKHLGEIPRKYQSDRRGYLSGNVYFYGKPSGDTSQETSFVQTQVVAQVSG